ncbi:phosphatase PAP2 family protein [Joostella atrarenae]|uniref:Phosphatase PAP2 family protein n=1 Tax=Joostella atrarenae TaxID=679257 RepID=A0ABS9J5Z5_9FLAO|nr:phosphatase PAP2 family protein [Joostella atrarenae]MCF8715834.1 phosphatase PAP2 family protein [Joostella atrarenae]
MLKKLLEYDRDVLIFLNNLGVEDHDGFWKIITEPLTWIPFYIFIIILISLTYKKARLYKTLFLSLAVALTTSGFTHLVKTTIGRIRPTGNDEFSEALRIIIEPTSYSFFSGHAANSFAVCTFFVLILRHKYKWIYICYLWPILFSASRLYLGVHYPSDILVGALVGVLMALIFNKIHQKWVLENPA